MFLPHIRRTARVIAAAIFTLLVAFVAVPALASHSEVSLPGSNFEIDTDANLKADDSSPSIDWASVSETRKADKDSGSGDDSFGNGTKEDTAIPSVIDGSIPPNKSDLKNFGVYLEENANGKFLHLFWHRVQEPSGTTNMDFEFNKSKVLSSNGVTPVRTEGDVLVQYDLSQGGTNPLLFVSRWVTSGAKSQCEAANSVPCWGKRANLTAAGDATGSINTSAIPSGEADGLGPISSRTFGEATLDFGALTDGTGCSPFGSAYLKSRSSDAFTAATKDFIAPANLDLDICGSIQVVKVTNGGSGTFNFTSDTLPDFSLTTTGSGVGGQAMSDVYGELQPGTYDVAETVPAGWALDSATCDDGSLPSAISLQAKEDIICTFTNAGFAKVSITKVDDDNPTNAVGGAVIKVYRDVAPLGGTAPDASDLAGAVVATCTTAAGTGTCTTLATLDADYNYWVVEDSVPAGYFKADAQLINPTPGQDVAVTFIDPRKFKVVTYVCRVADSTLYSSSVTLGSDTASSWASGAAPAGLSEATLCGVSTGATFGPMQHGTKSGSVTIPQ